MSDKHDPPPSKKIYTVIKNIIGAVTAGIVFPIMVAILIQDARFDPQRDLNSPTPTDSPIQTPALSNSDRVQLPSPTQQPPTPPQTANPELAITGIWEGTYTCSLGITGVTIDIDQTGNTVIADFSLYPVPENPNIPRGLARYEGDFNSTSRRMSFQQGTWINRPDNWIAYPFHGQFDENLKTFSGEMDGYRCTTISLTKRDS